MSTLKSDFAKKTSEAESLRLSLEKAEEMVAAARNLLDKLGGEKGRWLGPVRRGWRGRRGGWLGQVNATDTHAVVWRDRARRRIIVAFRGTEARVNIII